VQRFICLWVKEGNTVCFSINNQKGPVDITNVDGAKDLGTINQFSGQYQVWIKMLFL
jgi:hypothetical protein